VFKQSEGTKAVRLPYLGRPSGPIGGNGAEPREICVVVGGGSWKCAVRVCP